MTTGRKTPIIPPRNPLADSSALIGKRPVLPYRQALEARREKTRMRKFGAGKVGMLPTMEAPARILLPINPREHADHLHIGRNETAERRARRKIEEAQRRMEEEFRAAEAAGEADAATTQAARQPAPKPPQARYAALKDGRPA